MIGKNIKYYRNLAGLSQEELAKKVGLQKMAISYYENNKRNCDSQMVIKLADALGVKASALLMDTNSSAIITHAEFRKKSTTTNTSLNVIYGMIDHYLNKFHTILDILGETVLPDVPSINKYLYKDINDIEEAAKLIRKFLSLSITGPVGNIVDALENRGIIVCQIEYSDDFSGINGTLNGRPYIAINKNMPAERQRFTLIHELAHILFVFPYNIDQEKTIDAIAGAFLFPKYDVIREIGYSRTNILGALKPIQREYGISMQSILIRARQCNSITHNTYVEHQKWISSSGLRKDEKSGLIPETSCLFESLVVRAVSEDIINIYKGSELLDISCREVEVLCGI